MTKYALAPSLAAVILLSGCSTPTNPPDPAKIAGLIKLGTSTAISIGLVAIPDAAEAKTVAELSAKVLDENVLPILNGDPDALANALKSLLELKAFDDPRLAKAKLIMEVGLPLLENYLPADVLSGQADKIPPDVKAYLVGFFEGARDGISSYLGGRAIAHRDFSSFDDLRKKLSAK